MVDFLHIRTLSFVTSFLAIVTFILMLNFYYKRKTYQGFKCWTISFLFISIGFLLLGLRDFIPAFLSIVIANSLIIISVILIIQGLIIFCTAKKSIIVDIISFIFFIVPFSYFMFLNNLAIRIILVSLFLAFFFLRAAVIVKINLKRVLEKVDNILFLTFVIIGLWFFCRAILKIFQYPDNISNLMNEGIITQFTFIIYDFYLVFIFAGFIIVNTQRIEKDLKESQKEVKLLTDFLPICANCKKIRDDKGFWTQVEKYISDRSKIKFSHGLCPECLAKLYPELTK